MEKPTDEEINKILKQVKQEGEDKIDNLSFRQILRMIFVAMIAKFAKV